MDNRPNYTVFAGINGAGKSTLYDQVDKEKLGIRINPDEIAKELGDFNDPRIQIKAGKIAIIKIKECIENKVDFNQETTLTGKGLLRQMQELKESGYKISLHYVGLENKELANERVKQRVSEGGHNIPEATIYVKAFSSKFNKEFGRTKVSFDVTLVVTSCIISLLLFYKPVGVGMGTIIAALIVGLIAKFFNKILGFFNNMLLTDK